MQGAKQANWSGTQGRMSASRIRSQVGIRQGKMLQKQNVEAEKLALQLKKPLRSTGSKLATILVGRENKNNGRNKSKEGRQKGQKKACKENSNQTLVKEVKSGTTTAEENS